MNTAARDLLSHAVDPDAPDTNLFARLIGARIEQGNVPLLGLDAPALSALVARHFPHGLRDFDGCIAPDHPFYRDLRGLLVWHDRTAHTHADDARCLASIIAAASLRPDHLWRDLGLNGRDDVTEMLDRHYPTLVARNVSNLRWKKFFAQEVGHAADVTPTCAPGCPGCEDFAFCYPGRAQILVS
jgi:nitrogen fixation protein NifQ